MRCRKGVLAVLLCAAAVAVVLPAGASVPGEITLQPNVDANPPEASGLSASDDGIVFRTRSPDGLTNTWNILAVGSSTPVPLDPGGPLPASTVGGRTSPLIVGDEVAVPIAKGQDEYELAAVKFFNLNGNLIGSVPMNTDELWLGSTGPGAIVLERFPDASRKLVIREPGEAEDVLLDLSWGEPRGLITDTAGGFFTWMEYGQFAFQTYRLEFPADTATPFETSPDAQPRMSGLDPSDVMWRTSSNTIVVEPRSGDDQTRMQVGGAHCNACIEGSALSGATVAWTRTVKCAPGPCTYALQLRPVDGTGTDTGAGLKLTDNIVERASGGGFLVEGRVPGGHKTAILRVSEDGTDVTVVHKLQPLWAMVFGLAATGGRVAIADHSTDLGAVSSIQIADGGGGLTALPMVRLASDLGDEGSYGVPVLASGDRTAYVSFKPRNAVIIRGDKVERLFALDNVTGISRLSGDHLQFYSPGGGQRVLNLVTGKAVDVPNTAMLWGRWIAYLDAVTTTEGSTCWIVKRDLDAPKGTAPIPLTGTLPNCNTNILDWWGPWLALNVAGTGTIVNTDTNDSFTIPWDSYVTLGDGSLLALDYVSPNDVLTVMDLTDPGHPVTPVASFPAVFPLENPYALDQAGGQLVTWLGTDNLVHVAPTGIPASPPLELDRVVPHRFSPNGDGVADVWRPSFDVSKPVTWSMVLKNSAGDVVRHLNGDGPLGSLHPVWRGTFDSGHTVTDGVYDWVLKVHGIDGVGSLTLTGRVTVGT